MRFALAMLFAASASAHGAETVQVPWRAGNAESFRLGAIEEGHEIVKQGSLPVAIYRPAGVGPFPFVVLLHGCGGLKAEAMWSRWVQPWADLFARHGVGTAATYVFRTGRCSGCGSATTRRPTPMHGSRSSNSWPRTGSPTAPRAVEVPA